MSRSLIVVSSLHLLQQEVQNIKESLCYCALNPAEEDMKHDLEVSYVLPDGKTLKDGST